MLLDILNDISADFGYDIGVAEQKAFLISKINQAAKEIYDKTDLKGALREQVFDLDVDSAQVTFPFYVAEARAARHYDARLKITLNDYAPRYHYGMSNEVWPFRFRILCKSPLAREISNESILRFCLPIAEPANIRITVVGPTSNSSQIAENITLEAGHVEAASVGNFLMPLNSIQKSVVNTYDITIKDVEDNILGIIPNSRLNSEYTVAQINDFDSQSTDVIEVLYKHIFIPFTNDYDEFIAGRDYDKAIYWKFAEYEMARRIDTESAIAANAKCNAVVKELNLDKSLGIEKETNFAPCGLFDVSAYTVGRYSRIMYPHSLNGYYKP